MRRCWEEGRPLFYWLNIFDCRIDNKTGFDVAVITTDAATGARDRQEGLKPVSEFTRSFLCPTKHSTVCLIPTTYVRNIYFNHGIRQAESSSRNSAPVSRV